MPIWKTESIWHLKVRSEDMLQVQIISYTTQVCEGHWRNPHFAPLSERFAKRTRKKKRLRKHLPRYSRRTSWFFNRRLLGLPSYIRLVRRYPHASERWFTVGADFEKLVKNTRGSTVRKYDNHHCVLFRIAFFSKGQSDFNTLLCFGRLVCEAPYGEQRKEKILPAGSGFHEK